MSRLTRDGTAEPVSRDKILRHERGQGNIHFFCSADHVQDWQPYRVAPYSCHICVDHTSVLKEKGKQKQAVANFFCFCEEFVYGFDEFLFPQVN